MVTKKLIPDEFKLDGITEEGAKRITGSPKAKAICDYINHLVEAYNDRIDDVNEYYGLYNKKVAELEEFRKEHKIMARIIHDHGLWETFLNDDEFLEHLRDDDDYDILELKDDGDAVDNEE